MTDYMTREVEHRQGRSPSDPSTVITGSGGHVCSTDAGFLAVVARLVTEDRIAALAVTP